MIRNGKSFDKGRIFLYFWGLELLLIRQPKPFYLGKHGAMQSGLMVACCS